jgi:uncharacterized protein YutE (UPF0331/DUF86 family)
MARAARLRNLLVHQYSEVDDALFHELLADNLSDFDDFSAQVAAWVAKA